MKLKPLFYGELYDGKMTWYDPEGLKKYLLSLGDLEVQVLVEKKKKWRSDNQNRYYWGVVIDILGSELGYNPEEMHEALKWQFLRVEGGKIPTVKSTASLSTVEFEDYMGQIRTWASIEFGVYIPEPNEAPVV